MKHPCTNFFLSLLPFVLVLLCGCGGNSNMTPGNSAQTTNLRVVNGDGGINSVNVVVDGTSVGGNVTFLAQTNYTPVLAGKRPLVIGGLFPPNMSFLEDFPANANTTLAITGCGTQAGGAVTLSGGFLVLIDDVTPPTAGNFKLRLVDGAIITPFFDVYVLPAGVAPSGTPTVSSMNLGQNPISPYISFAAGSYHIVVTQLGNATILFDSGPISFGAGQNRTYYLFQDGSVQPGFISCGAQFKPMLLADLN